MENSVNSSLDMSGSTVIVTGGARGVGRGITEVFLAAGANVLICGRTEPDELPEVNGNTAVFTQCDVKDPDSIQACVDAAVARFKRIDTLVNNAGGTPHADSATASPRFNEAIIRLNLVAPFTFSQAVNRVMQEQDSGGSIINIASVSAIRPSPGTAAYGAAKAGLINLCTSLAVEWGPKVRVNAITAGLIQTEQSHLHYGDQAGIDAVGRTIPMQRMAIPQDIGNACLYLASPLASFVTGTSLEVHGGGEIPAIYDAQNAT